MGAGGKERTGAATRVGAFLGGGGAVVARSGGGKREDAVYARRVSRP